MSRTAQDLIDDVRAQTDESSAGNLSDAQILSALNRGLRHATNITARKYEDLFWAKTTLTTVAGQREYPIPDNAFGRRVEMLEVMVGESAYKLRRMSNHQRSAFVTGAQVSRPYYYTLTKNTIEIHPAPSAGLTLNVHYSDAPENLVAPQGRVTSINAASSYVLLDAVGEDLTTSVTGFGCYVNFIDGVTGAVRGTAQVSAINSATGQVTFKSAGLTRNSVLGKTVSTSLPEDLEADDYVCLVTGTCVPELPDAYSDYIVQHAVTAIRRRFGEPTQEEYGALKELESELLKMWAGREIQSRVRKASQHWRGFGGRTRRLFT